MILKKIFLLLLLTSPTVFAQYNNHNFGLSLNGVFTTSADLFLNPNSSDPTIRNQSFTLEDILNPGLDFRYRLTEEVIIGLNVEYMQKTTNAPNLIAFVGNDVISLEVQDGFRLIPVELSVHYLFPFSTEEFKFLMGGGMGYYHGEFLRQFNDAKLSVVERKFAVGIHVSATMEFMVINNVSLRFEMKFRDPQFNVKSRYTKTEVMYEGNVIHLPEEEFETKVNVNGIAFVLGAVFHY